MPGIIKHLLKDKSGSKSKSYFVGLHRGRIWAETHGDYYEVKEWAKLKAKEFDRLVLPGNEKKHFEKFSQESELDWKKYLEGWLEGVREVAN